jgi:hypothetical protein
VQTQARAAQVVADACASENVPPENSTDELRGRKDDALPHKRNLDATKSGLSSTRKRVIRSKPLMELNEEDAPQCQQL